MYNPTSILDMDDDVYVGGIPSYGIDDLLIEEPSVYLKCPICHNVYLEPVVNIKCGHSFCKHCVLGQPEPGNGGFQCPIDGEVCSVKLFVANRVIQDQIDNLLIRCKFYNKSNKSGCTDIIKYGEISEHGNVCAYAYIKCPYKPDLCGEFMKKDLRHHLDSCQFFSTCKEANTTEIDGCSFLKAFDDCKTTEDEVKALRSSLVIMFSKIEEISCRLRKLEENNAIQENSLGHEDGYESIEELLERKCSMRAHSLNPFRPCDDFWVMPFQFKCIGTMRCHSSTVTSIAVWDQNVFSSDMEGNVKVWRLDALEKGSQRTLKAGTKKINSAIVYKDHLYTAGDDSVIKCWNSKLLEISSVEKAHEESITSLLCSREKLFSASFTNVKVWRCLTMDYLHIIEGLHHWARSLACSVSSDKLYIGAHRTVSIWKNSIPFKSVGQIEEPIGSVYSLTITKQYIIAGTYNKNIYIYDVNTLQSVHHFTGHVGIINCLRSPNVQKFLISCSSDSTILLWCLEKMLPIQAIHRHDGDVTCAAIVDDMLITGSEDKEIKIFKQFKSI